LNEQQKELVQRFHHERARKGMGLLSVKGARLSGGQTTVALASAFSLANIASDKRPVPLTRSRKEIQQALQNLLHDQKEQRRDSASPIYVGYG
jgi:hypothetical protein